MIESSWWSFAERTPTEHTFTFREEQEYRIWLQKKWRQSKPMQRQNIQHSLLFLVRSWRDDPSRNWVLRTRTGRTFQFSFPDVHAFKVTIKGMTFSRWSSTPVWSHTRVIRRHHLFCRHPFVGEMRCSMLLIHGISLSLSLDVILECYASFSLIEKNGNWEIGSWELLHVRLYTHLWRVPEKDILCTWNVLYFSQRVFSHETFTWSVWWKVVIPARK